MKSKGRFPGHLVVICSSLGKNFDKFVKWCEKFGIKEITICTRNKISLELQNCGVKINLVNFSGKEEIMGVIKIIAEKAMKGEIKIEEIDERLFESFLNLRSQPDLIIKAGKEVPEFLIWQSVYSELLFIDIDWDAIRYIDFLRIIREYQRRERRYGR